MKITTMQEAVYMVYESYVRALKNLPKEDDSKIRKPELTRRLLNVIGRPDQRQKNIIVTGSKGKGSTARMISSILSHMGYRVGLFTSPHLVNFNERIRIDGKAISDQDFILYANEIARYVEEIDRGLTNDIYQGPIGIALAIAMKYFAVERTDFNVIECGRGGTYDDVNVLENKWAVITPIMEEHLTYLGPTIQDVAVHKAGIVKPETKMVFVSRQKPEVTTVLQNIIADVGTQAFFSGDDFWAENVTMDEQGVHFQLQSDFSEYAALSLPLLGTFQADNAATAVCACENILGVPIPGDLLQQCFANLTWPGRCEIISQDPTVIVDGAINAESAEYVKEVIAALGKPRVISVVSVPADKDYEGVIRVVSGFSRHLIVTKPDYSNKVFPEDALATAQKYLSSSHEENTLADAMEYLKSREDADIILIVGTQNFIGNAKRLWQQSLLDIGV